jgi:hypothetical protein
MVVVRVELVRGFQLLFGCRLYNQVILTRASCVLSLSKAEWRFYQLWGTKISADLGWGLEMRAVQSFIECVLRWSIVFALGTKLRALQVSRESGQVVWLEIGRFAWNNSFIFAKNDVHTLGESIFLNLYWSTVLYLIIDGILVVWLSSFSWWLFGLLYKW